MTGRRKWFFFIPLFVLVLVGMAALWRSTPYGLGLVNDSATYVEGATSLLAGKGYVRTSGGGELKPITHFPPFFSLLLAGLGLAGMDLLQGARVLITLLFGVDILLVGLSVYKISHSIAFAWFGALLLAVSDLHIGVFSFALSEPLFLTLMLAAFLCLAEAIDRPHWGWMALTGFLLSLAYLTRYAGASLILAAILVLVLLRPTKTLKRIGVMLGGAILPILAWMGYNLALSGLGSLGNRQLVWHPAPLRSLFEALKNLLTWIAPNDLLAAGPIWGRLLSLLSLLLLPGLLAWLVWVVRRRFKFKEQEGKLNGSLILAFTLALHVLVYLGFLVVSLSLFDASTPLDDRILSVIYLPEMILFASGLAWLWTRFTQRIAVLRWVLVIFCVTLALFSVKDGIAVVNQLRQEGQGFAHRGWSESPAIRAIRDMPPVVIYSNKPGAIFLLTGKSAYVVPTPIDTVTGLPRSNYSTDLAQMQQRVRQGQAVLVLFDLRDSADPDEVQLFEDLSSGLTVQADYGDAVIFGASP
jgi:4-amino-4-deoxy-L-arabinose transferase-like glycosyltransferase